MLASLSVWPQAAEEAIATTLCEILKNPASFDGKTVALRVTHRSNFEIAVLTDSSCEAGDNIWLAFGASEPSPAVLDEMAPLDSFADLKHTERLRWRPVGMHRVLLKLDKNMGESIRITTGFGHFGGWRVRITVESVTDIDAVKIRNKASR